MGHRAGRKRRQDVTRYQSGKPRYAAELGCIPVQDVTLAQRAVALGIPVPDRESQRQAIAKRVEAATAAGVLLARGIITARQHQAARRYEDLVDDMRRLTCAPLGWLRRADGGPEPVVWEAMSDEARARMADQLRSARQMMVKIYDAVRHRPAPGLALAAMESIVIDGVLPPLPRDWDQADRIDKLRVGALQHGLDAVAEVYRIP